MDVENKMPRREFVKSAAILASATAVPAIITAGCAEKKVFPKGKLNIALVGLHMGFNNLKKCSDENLVALCDVDEFVIERRLENFREEYPDRVEPYIYQDYRKMLKEVGDQIDAVIIATPDQTHANITLEAMKMGMHVYTQKPLTHSVYESRLLTQAAKKYPVATQMGNQGASNVDTARVCASIWNGDIGEVTEVHAWTNRPKWPQCLNFPEDSDKYKMPPGLKWDLWLGPAPERPYHPAYHPWNWRGRWDFGTGALGDMACHIMDIAMRSLRLKYPDAIEASSSKWTMDSPPESEKISFYFPERKRYKNVNMPPVKLTWYDGGLMPDRPIELDDGEQMGNRDGGVMFIGTKGKIVCGCYARDPIFLPKDKFENYEPTVEERLVDGGISGHEKDWLRACKESPDKRVKAKSHFEYAGPFNEVVVMGTVAARLAGLNRVLKWDGENMEFTNIHPEDKIQVARAIKLNEEGGKPRFNKDYEEINAYEYAQSLIKRKPRPGWELEV